MKKFLWFLLISLAVCGVAVVTCPDRNAHEEFIKSRIASAVGEASAEEGGFYGAALVSGFASGLAGWFLTGIFNVDNCLVYSVGSINYDGRKEIVTIGVFNHVFPVRNEELADRLKQEFE